jgi:casein kinase 1
LIVPEEFGIYLNYVRKLGFEETPDYDFLRELFSKVMKSNNDLDDGVFDWNLLNGPFTLTYLWTSFLNDIRWQGLGSSGGERFPAAMIVSPSDTWLSLGIFLKGQSQMLAQMQNAGLVQDRRRDNRDSDRRRSQGGNIVPPSPALVRHGSKQRRVPGALTPGGGNGQFTPHSAAAQVNIPVGTPQRVSAQHPYANPGTGGYDYGRDGDDAYGGQQQYGRASPMVSSVGAAPPAMSDVRARGGDAGISHGDGYNGRDVEEAPPKPSLLRILTCRC